MSKTRFPDFATGKPVNIRAPEEQVRQEYERVLIESYGYPRECLDIEVKIPRGSGFFPDLADIVVYDSAGGRVPAEHILGIVETKKPRGKDGLNQVKSYMTATSALWGVWTNGEDIVYLCRRGRKIVEGYLNNIPAFGQSIDDVGQLQREDLHPFGRSELKSAFRRILNRLYANTNISRKEKLGGEMIKLIFAKIYDEQTYVERPPAFRAGAGEDPAGIAGRVKELFSGVRDELAHDGIFSAHENIELDDRSLCWVVGQLERGSLLQTDTDFVGDAFEVFSEPRLIGEKGEFFTPRGVVHVAVNLAAPRPGETVVDPACGSGGFLISAMKHIWTAMENDPKWRGTADIKKKQKEMAARCFFGIDKENDLVKIAKAHMAIAGDGRSNITHDNSLHKADNFSSGGLVEDARFKQFDIVLTNPPFGTKTKVLKEDAALFRLGHAWEKRENGWVPTSRTAPRDPYILFIERCLELLKDGGTLAIVLPESVFHAPTLGYVREFMLAGNNVRAIVDLPHNTFRPHCNAKTCLLVLAKNQAQQDNIILAAPAEMGHDHTGRVLHRPETDEVWDDLPQVIVECGSPNHPDNQHVFAVGADDMHWDTLIPRFYRHIKSRRKMPRGTFGVSLGSLVEKGVIESWDGHGSPRAEEKGRGDIPYIRVSDIVNWEMYRNPVTGLPYEEYQRVLGKNGRKPQAGDVIFVRRGSYRIGTVAMASPRDANVLLTRELLTLRVTDDDNEYGLNPYYLLATLSRKIVQEQMPDLTFVDTTLPNLGDRWKRLVLPIHRDRGDIDRITHDVETSIREKWSAQDRIDSLRTEMGDVTT